MTEIVKAGGHSQALSLSVMSVQDAWGFAKALSESSILPRAYQGNPGSVLWALEYGRGIGLDVVTTIQSVHLIQGRATMSADLMASLTRRAGHRMRVVSTDDRAEVTIFRADDPEFPFVAAWDVQKAATAKLLGKDTWKQYQGQMLRARAISECVRMACPEVLHGCIYTPEEIGANVDAEGVPMDAPVQPLRAVPAQRDGGTPDTGGAVVDAECLVSHPEALAIALKARSAATMDGWREAWKAADSAKLLDAVIETPDTQEWETLREYLTRRGTELRQPAPARMQSSVVDSEVVVDERAAALDDLRAAAIEADIADSLAQDFAGSYGVPIEQGTIQQYQQMANLLRGAA